jgi:hypothetical protein
MGANVDNTTGSFFPSERLPHRYVQGHQDYPAVRIYGHSTRLLGDRLVVGSSCLNHDRGVQHDTLTSALSVGITTHLSEENPCDQR